MNKKLFYIVASSILVGCSSNNDNIEALQGSTVKVSIEAQVGANVTRSFLGDITNNKMSVPLESSDLCKLYDAQGSYDFTPSTESYSQSTVFDGSWNVEKNEGFAAIIPNTGGSVSFDANNIPEFTLNIPSKQQTRVFDNQSQVSYPTAAAYLVAGRGSKYSTDGLANTMFFVPVTSYVYFWSTQKKVNVTSNNPISGSLKVTPTVSSWTATNEETAIKMSGIVCSGGTTIESTGTLVTKRNYSETDIPSGTTVWEHIICIAPGSHILSFEATNHEAKSMKKAFTFEHKMLNYIGCVDGAEKPTTN